MFIWQCSRKTSVGETDQLDHFSQTRLDMNHWKVSLIDGRRRELWCEHQWCVTLQTERIPMMSTPAAGRRRRTVLIWLNVIQTSLIHTIEFFSKQPTKIPSACSVQSREIPMLGMARISFVQITTRQVRGCTRLSGVEKRVIVPWLSLVGVWIHFPLGLGSNTLPALINTRPESRWNQ